MKFKLSLLFVIIFLSTIKGHPQQILLRSVPIINQLPSNSVQRIFQDKEGFMWFGTTNGLCRYDGYRVLVFRSNQKRPHLLTSNKITCFAEDQNNHLLIGTNKGVNVLNKSTYEITPLEGNEIAGREIKCIVVTSEGSVWIGTNKSVVRYNKDLTFNKQYENSLPITSINSLYEDSEKNLWVTLWRSGLYKYDSKNDTFTGFPIVGDDNNPFKVFQDSKKQYWVCTWGDGLYLFNPKELKNPYTKVKIENTEKQISEDKFFSITQDNKYGYIWVMSGSGISALEYTPNNELKEVDVSYLFKESNNIFSEIIKDNKGNLWIATFGEGVLTINLDRQPIRNYPMSFIKRETSITPNITSLYKDRDGEIWISQNRWGLGIYSPTSNTARFYKDMPALKNIPSLGVLSCISGFRSSPNEVWVGPENEAAIYIMRKEGKDIVISKRIDLREISPDAGNPFIFYEDRQNNIWIGTTTGLLLKPYNSDKIEIINTSIGEVSNITEDTRGTIWINCKNSGLYHIPLSSKNVSDKLNVKNSQGFIIDNNDIEAICADMSGKIWIGTKDGEIIQYDVISQQFTHLSNNITFKMIEEGIQDILIDDYGHLWISTNKRVKEYNPENGASRDYLESDGVWVNSFHLRSQFKDKTEILFGGNRGISIFTPSEVLSGKARQTKVLITDIKVNNLSVSLNSTNQNFDILSQKLSLKPNERNIEIDFSSLEYAYSSKIRYAYKMEGIDEDWVYPENNRQFAIYNQLSKGSYSFYLKTTDENGLWSDTVTLLTIYREPAFYETWWAYIFYFIVLAIIIFWGYTIAKRRLKLRNELRIAQIEKEKAEDLTQTKLRYFTNISHDFLTPLTIISCLIDDAEITYKGKISQFSSMRSNINRLKRLLQQVLDFRKVESGNMQLKLSQGDIVIFIKDICETHFIPLMKKKNIRFSFSCNESNIQGLFDADKVDKVIFNLLSNAYKYTPENGAVKIELIKYIKENHTYINIKISDTGVGIPPEDLESIFARFYTNRKNISGDTNGIGLSLTKDLLSIHHGTIQVASKVQEGTQFIIDIPIDEASYSDTERGNPVQINLYDELSEITEEKILEEPISDNTNKDNTTILLVEDNEELLILVKNILAKHYNVLTANNGAEALATVKDKDIDIIVSDVMMPEMDGLELCKKLKSNLETSHIPVILLTAKNSVEDRIDCYNAGADGYISKPFDVKVLEARINNFMSNKKTQQSEFKSDVEINISTLDYPSIDEQFLNSAIAVIEQHLPETEFDVNTFADNLNMSKSSLYRKIKTMTGLSPNEFIRNIRLKHACQLLKDPSISISEVAYLVGFSIPKYFTMCFKAEFNMTPSEYQKSLNNE